MPKTAVHEQRAGERPEVRWRVGEGRADPQPEHRFWGRLSDLDPVFSWRPRQWNWAAHAAREKNDIARRGCVTVKCSVADPDPYVFGWPPDPDLIRRYGSGSGSFYYRAKMIRKSLISTVKWVLYYFLSLKNDGNVPTSKKQKTFFCVLKVNDQNVTDPQHWFNVMAWHQFHARQHIWSFAHTLFTEDTIAHSTVPTSTTVTYIKVQKSCEPN